MEFVDGAVIHADSGTLPAHQAGDLLIVLAVKWDSGLPTPSVPSGWTQLATATGTFRRVVGYRIAAVGGSGSSTSTWTAADDLYVAVYRYATPGAAASSASASNTAQVPGLTLQQPGVSSVLVFGDADIDAGVVPGLPAGTVTRKLLSSGVLARWADTDGPVASWPAKTANPWDLVVAVELIPTETPVGITYQPSWDVEAFVGLTYQPSWDVEELSVGITYQPSWDVEAFVGITYQPSWDVEDFGSWPDLIRTSEWAEAVVASGAVIDAYAELVDADGNPVSIEVDGVAKDRLPLSAASVTFSGSQGEQWSASLSFTDSWMVPRAASHPLWGISPLRVRLWWGVLSGATWLWMPVCTLALGDVSAADDGTISGSVRARDVLSTIRGGYAGMLDIAGENVASAIRMVIDRCAPTLDVSIAETDEVVPDGVVLGEDDALADLRELAAIGWPDGRVLSDREGRVTVGPQPEPAGPVIDWQEGPRCLVSEMRVAHGVEQMGNQATAVSTHPDAGGVSVTVADDDPSSPTWIGGPWGVHPLPVVRSDKTTSEAGLKSLAQMALGKGLRPTEGVEVTVPQRPDLGYRHPVLLARQQLGVAGIHRVLSWQLSLPVRGVAPAPMSVSMMQEYR